MSRWIRIDELGIMELEKREHCGRIWVLKKREHCGRIRRGKGLKW